MVKTGFEKFWLVSTALLLFFGAENGGVFRVIADGFGGGQAELADDVLGTRAGDGRVENAAAIGDGVFVTAVVVVQVAADAVAGEIGADVQRLAVHRGQPADATTDGLVAEIDIEGDGAVFGVAIDDIARVVRAAAGRHGGIGRRLDDVEMAVAVAGGVVAAEAGVGEVAVEDLPAAAGAVAMDAVAAVEIVGIVAVGGGDGGAVAAGTPVREVAFDTVAVGARGGRGHAVQAAPVGGGRGGAVVLVALVGVEVAGAVRAVVAVMLHIDADAGAADGDVVVVAAAGGKREGGDEDNEAVVHGMLLMGVCGHCRTVGGVLAIGLRRFT